MIQALRNGNRLIRPRLYRITGIVFFVNFKNIF